MPSSTTNDVGGHRPRRVDSTVRASSLAEVRATVREAVAHEHPLYPISTGCNWGMGSGVPALDDCAVLDLSGMKRIRTLDLVHGYAVIEPGVTQRELATALEGSRWLLNVTSSCADTSVVGNALDRGDGTLRPRPRDLLGFELVLGDGTVITTGGLDRQGRYQGTVAGPDLTTAMVQSNLGIVTAMAVSLVPRPDVTGLFAARFPRTALRAVLESMGELLRGRLPTTGMMCVGGLTVAPAPSSQETSPLEEAEWFTITGPLLGSVGAVALAETTLRSALGSIPGDLRFTTADAVDEQDPLYPRALLASGIPTCRIVRHVLRLNTCDVDRGQTGFLALMPTLPLDGDSAQRAVAIVQEAVDTHPVEAAVMEWNLVSHHNANCVVQIFFERTRDGIAQAHQMRARARKRLLDLGYPAYRSDIDSSVHDLTHRSPDGIAAVAARIKAALDPQGVISPGRYVGDPSPSGTLGVPVTDGEES